MSSTLRRGAIAATVTALSIGALAACGAGTDAQTGGVNPDNASVSEGDIKIQNVNIVTREEGEGPAVVSARIFNDGTEDETLRTVTISGSGGPVQLSAAKGGDLTVPAGGSLMLGGKDNATAVIEDPNGKGILDGNAQPVTFDLSSTGKVKLDATVVPARGAYADFGPSAQPEPASPSPDEDAAQQDDAARQDEEQDAGQQDGTGEDAEQPGDAGEQGPEQPGDEEPGTDEASR